jgi:hypothetical protein
VEEKAMTLASRVTVPAAVLFRDLGDEAVVLHTSTGRYFGLDEVGARMWTSLATTGVIAEAFRGLSAAYDVAPADLERDLLAFVRQLVDNELLVVVEV